MPLTASNIVVAKPVATGGILVAPVGTALPTDATTAPDQAFVATGYVGDEGIKPKSDRKKDEVRAWGGDVVKMLLTETTQTYEFTFLEMLNSDVLRTTFGVENVTVTPAAGSKGTLYAIKINGLDLPNRAFIFDMKDGDARLRIVVPNASIMPDGGDAFTHSKVTSIGCSLTALPDENGQYAYMYFDDGITAA